jgi:hypothetical protein
MISCHHIKTRVLFSKKYVVVHEDHLVAHCTNKNKTLVNNNVFRILIVEQ